MEDGIGFPYEHDVCFLSLIVPRKRVKEVKQALELHGLLDKTRKITPTNHTSHDRISTSDIQVKRIGGGPAVQSRKDTEEEDDFLPSQLSDRSQIRCPTPPSPGCLEERFIIPTTFHTHAAIQEDNKTQANLARDTLLSQINLPSQTAIEAHLCSRKSPSPQPPNTSKSLLAQAVRKWLLSLPTPVRATLPIDINTLLNASKWTYTIYPPMLLLPPSFLSQDPWPEILAQNLRPHLPALYTIICDSEECLARSWYTIMREGNRMQIG
ncbi:MAG: hypothetical protein L6R39_006966 [Caloplaca ligustica]|nr:MAG: hypothetical protein L6R39_006966 [Caloplaca ligustica]